MMAVPAPVTPVPVTVPAPMAAMPVPSPVPMMSPPHLFGGEVIDFILGNDSGISAFAPRWRETLRSRNRRQRRSLRARSQRAGAGGQSKGEFQKVAAFHDISSSAVVSGEESFAADR
jgi:hypothetical protein